MGLSTSWAVHAWSRALTAAYIMGKLPVACIAGGKVIVLGPHHKVLDGIQQKLGKAHQAACINRNTGLHFGQSASCVQQCSCMPCRCKMIMFGPHYLVEHRPGSARQAMCIGSNISLHQGQTASCMPCRRRGDWVWTSSQGVGWH